MPSRSLPFSVSAAALTGTGAAFDVRPTLAFSEEYSDNFNLTAENKVQNFRSALTPGVIIGINGPKTQGAVFATLSLTQDSTNQLGDLGIFSSLSASVKHTFDPRLVVTLADTFTRNDNPALSDPFGLRQQRQTYASNTLSLSVDWLLDAIAAQAYYNLSTFFSDSNTISSILGVNAGLPLGRAMAVRAGYEFSHSDVSGDTSGHTTGNLLWASLSRQVNALTTAGIMTTYSMQTIDDARIWNASVFATYELAGRLSVSGRIGYSLLGSDSQGNLSTMSANGTVTYRFASGAVSVGIFQDFNQTFTAGENFGIVLTRSYWGSVSYAPTAFIDASVRVSYNENEFTGIGSPSGNDDTFAAQAGLTWRALRWLTAGLDYTYSRYGRSASSGGVAPENRVAFRVTASF